MYSTVFSCFLMTVKTEPVSEWRCHVETMCWNHWFLAVCAFGNIYFHLLHWRNPCCFLFSCPLNVSGVTTDRGNQLSCSFTLASFLLLCCFFSSICRSLSFSKRAVSFKNTPEVIRINKATAEKFTMASSWVLSYAICYQGLE